MSYKKIPPWNNREFFPLRAPFGNEGVWHDWQVELIYNMKYIKIIAGILFILLAIGNMIFWWIMDNTNFITSRIIRIQVWISMAGLGLGSYFIYDGIKMRKQTDKKQAE